jgi:hypothetical protein
LEDYHFHAGSVPSGYHPEFEVALFNEEKHRLLQAAVNWQSFYILNQKRKRVSGAVHFHLSEGVAQSPLRSPFGSVEFTNEIPAEILFEFLKSVEGSLREQGISTIRIKNYPQAYSEQESILLQSLLINLNYRIVSSEIDSVIEVTSEDGADFFNRSAGRRLQKAKEAGLIVKRLEIEKLDEIYGFIKSCRSEKQYPVSMTLADLQRTVTLFPDRYFLFGVFNHQELVAASIAIRVKKNILYDFYHDHAASYDHLSPVVLLVSGIYEFCHQVKITLLDLGTSALDGIPNFSLLHFKKTLGGKSTAKFIFEKLLSDG